MLETGKNAPAFCLPDQDEEKKCLKDFKGKWLVLYFYPKDNTSGCTLEAKDFTGAVKDFDNLDTTIIGISPDSIDSHKKFIAKQSLNLTLLSDADHEVLEKYGVWQLKKLYGREYYGVVRSTFLIDPKGNIQHIWPKVKVKGHVDDVKNVLIEKQK